MRMPILAYFLVVGTVLFGGLVLVSTKLESKPLPVSQRIGVPPPFQDTPVLGGVQDLFSSDLVREVLVVKQTRAQLNQCVHASRRLKEKLSA
jgi:hypothetical protein